MSPANSPGMRSLLVAFSLLAGACAGGELVGFQTHGDGGTSHAAGDGGSTSNNGGGDGGTTQPMTCPAGTHLDNGVCIADEVTCAEEFPCDNGQTCVGGRCITKPGACTS